MKIFTHITLLLFVVGACVACKGNQTSEYKKYYSSINREYESHVNRDLQEWDDEDYSASESFSVDDEIVEDLAGCDTSDQGVDYKPATGIATTVAQAETTIEEQSADIHPVAKNDQQRSYVAQTTPPSFVAQSLPQSGPSPEVDAYLEQTDNAEYANYTPKEALLAMGMQVDAKVSTKGSIRTVKDSDYGKLKKYSVVVATLAKASGIGKLEKSFDKADITYFIVKNPAGRYYFVIYSSDSEEAAIKARANFLIKHTVNKTRQQIWAQYLIPLTDTFILHKD